MKFTVDLDAGVIFMLFGDRNVSLTEKEQDFCADCIKTILTNALDTNQIRVFQLRNPR